MNKSKVLGAAVALGFGAAVLTSCGGSTPSTPKPQYSKEQYEIAYNLYLDNVKDVYEKQYGYIIQDNDLTFVQQSVNTKNETRVLNGYFKVKETVIDEKFQEEVDNHYYFNLHVNNYNGGSTQYECLTYFNNNFNNLNLSFNRTYLLDEAWNKMQQYEDEQLKYIFSAPQASEIAENEELKIDTVSLGGKINSLDLSYVDDSHITFTINSTVNCTYGNNQNNLVQYEQVTLIDLDYKNYIIATTNDGVLNDCVMALPTFMKYLSTSIFYSNESSSTLQEDMENAKTQAEIDSENEELVQ